MTTSPVQPLPMPIYRVDLYYIQANTHISLSGTLYLKFQKLKSPSRVADHTIIFRLLLNINSYAFLNQINPIYELHSKRYCQRLTLVRNQLLAPSPSMHSTLFTHFKQLMKNTSEWLWAVKRRLTNSNKGLDNSILLFPDKFLRMVGNEIMFSSFLTNLPKLRIKNIYCFMAW